jgi:hypothetical protein
MDITEFNQGEYTFYLRPMDPFKSLDLLGDLQKTVLPALGAALGKTNLGAAGDEPGEELPTQKEAVTLSKLLSKELDVENALKQLSAAVSGAKLNDLLTRILNGDYISYGPYGDRDKVKKLDRAALAAIYNGKLKGMFELAWQVLRVNYSDFFIT